MDRKCDRFALMVAPWLLAASVPAVAGTVYQWNGGNCLTGASLVSTCTDTSTVPAGGPTLTYSAISDTAATTNGQRGLASAYVGNYNPNLGITSRAGPNSSPANTQETTAAPDHAIDNNGNSEFMELSFASAVNLSQVQLGYYSGDSDITVLAYTGAGTPTFSGRTYSNTAGLTGLLQNGWALVGNYFNVCTSGNGTCTTADPGTATISTTYVSSYWLIGAYNNLGAAITNDTTKDYVKLLTMSACYGGTGANCLTPPTAVPEPSSLLLAAIGLFGLSAARRRRPA